MADGSLYLAQRSNADGLFVFGDGSHPTTRLCAGAVDLLCRQQLGASVLDVGTGTGILARIARGASFVAGTDIDPASLAAAAANAALDDPRLPAIHFGPELPDAWGAIFDLVVANILAEPLVELAPRLARALAPRGVLLISGFTRLQAQFLRQPFETHGLCCQREAHDGEWMLLLFGAATGARAVTESATSCGLT